MNFMPITFLKFEPVWAGVLKGFLMESVECFTELLVTGGGVVSECDTGHQSFTGRIGNLQKQSNGSEGIFISKRGRNNIFGKYSAH